MASTTFVDGETLIEASWLNDVNAAVYTPGTIDAANVSNTPAGNIAATDVQAALNELDSEKQPLDATLTALAGLATGADKLAYSTGADTFAETAFTPFARTVLDDADAATARATLGIAAIDSWPVGSVFIAVVATNPNTLLGGGTWAAFGAGRVLVGIDAGQTEFDTVEKTGGAKTHTLSTAEMPSHTHTESTTSTKAQSGGSAGVSVSDSVFITGDTGSSGGGGAHNNLQPYIVCYFWKRTA